jgi:hypothetical protein
MGGCDTFSWYFKEPLQKAHGAPTKALGVGYQFPSVPKFTMPGVTGIEAKICPAAEAGAQGYVATNPGLENM